MEFDSLDEYMNYLLEHLPDSLPQLHQFNHQYPKELFKYTTTIIDSIVENNTEHGRFLIEYLIEDLNPSSEEYNKMFKTYINKLHEKNYQKLNDGPLYVVFDIIMRNITEIDEDIKQKALPIMRDLWIKSNWILDSYRCDTYHFIKQYKKIDNNDTFFNHIKNYPVCHIIFIYPDLFPVSKYAYLLNTKDIESMLSMWGYKCTDNDKSYIELLCDTLLEKEKYGFSNNLVNNDIAVSLVLLSRKIVFFSNIARKIIQLYSPEINKKELDRILSMKFDSPHEKSPSFKRLITLCKSLSK